MATRTPLPHEHRWEIRGRKRWSFGVWVSTYECACGDDMPRLLGGRKTG